MESNSTNLEAQAFELLFPQDQIHRVIRKLGSRISDDYRGERIVLLGVLKGCFIFMADLIRTITVPVEAEFIDAKSYGAELDPGELKLSGGPWRSLKGRHVLLVEAVVDTGRTARSIVESVKRMEPTSIEIVTLLNKKGRREGEISIKYAGFDVGDDFVIGYGLDYNQIYRNLPFIGKIIDNYGG